MSITQTSIGLSWTAPSGGGAVTDYDVLYRVTGTGAFAILASVTGTSYNATGLIPGTSYDFAVYGRNGAGPGGLSGTVTAATFGAVPNAPGSVTASAGSPAYSVVALAWTAPPTDSTHGPATSYTISYSPGNTGAWTQLATGITGTSRNITSLSADTLYGFKVDAVNAIGTNVSGTTTTITTDYAPPNVPTAVAVAPVPDGTTSKLAVTWSAPATDSTHGAATGYNVQYQAVGAGSWTAGPDGPGTSATLTGLSSGTSYNVQVQATNASTTSPGAWSGTTTASTYSTVMSWHTAPPTPDTHGTGGLVANAYTTPNPAGTVGVDWYWSTSATVNTPGGSPGNTSRSTGGTDNGYPIWTNVWGAYLSAPATAGTYYVWAVVHDNSGALVSSAITVT